MADKLNWTDSLFWLYVQVYNSEPSSLSYQPASSKPATKSYSTEHLYSRDYLGYNAPHLSQEYGLRQLPYTELIGQVSDLVDKYWNGARSLTVNSKFTSKWRFHKDHGYIIANFIYLSHVYNQS